MNFFGIDLFLNSMDEMISTIFDDMELNRKTAYYAINPDCMLISKNNIGYYKILKASKQKVYADGKWIINTQKILGLPVSEERIATTDLFPRLLEVADYSQKKVRIFLLGGREGTPEKVILNMQKKYKYVEFVGSHNGYFDKEQSEEVIDIINKSKANILFVGFGCPIQEQWVDKNIKKIDVNSIITCGGLFDYYANNVKRAPKWMQNIGLEWLFRLIQEPKRLYKRYIFGNLKYLSWIIYIKMRGKKYYRKKYM